MKLPKILRVLPIVAAILCSFIVPNTVSATQALTTFESYTAGDNVNASCYGSNWQAQSFTTGATPHTVADVQLKSYIAGSPGTIYVYIYATSSHLPTGAALASGSLNANTMTTSVSGAWYTISLSSPYSLASNTEYAEVFVVPNGDSSDYVNIRVNNAGTYSGGEYSATNGGSSWTGYPLYDVMFVIQGTSSLVINSAKVFRSYLASGDALIMIEVTNTALPYYQLADSSEYFVIQLYDPTDTNILAQVPLAYWGDAPESIYLSPNVANTFTNGGAYIITVTGTYATPPSVSYTLQTSDWKVALPSAGTNSPLGKWIIDTATNMDNTYGYLGTANDFLSSGIKSASVLSTNGQGYFINTIPQIGSMMPDLFGAASIQPTYVAGSSHNVYDNSDTWQNTIGTPIAGDVSAVAAVVGLDGSTLMMIGLLIIMAIILVLGAVQGLPPEGMLLFEMPVLFAGNYLHVISIVVTLMIGAVMAVLFVRKFWWTST